MSFSQSLFRNAWGTLVRKARSTEDFGGRVIANFKVLRRGVYYAGVIYCSGQLFQYYILQHGQAAGQSMYPTMPASTPFTLVSKLHAHGKNMGPGDIINFTSPIFRSQLNGKRVIGMPGDYVVQDVHQAPSVGGAPVPGITDWRSQAEKEKGIELKEREQPKMIEVPEGHVYVVGDNLSYSRDSRFFGPVPLALVNGKQIVHSQSALSGWHWTGGEQMRRIPKEQEEEYLKGWRQRQVEHRQAAGQKTTAQSATGVD